MVTEEEIQDACLTIVRYAIGDEKLWALVPESFKKAIREKAKDAIISSISKEQVVAMKALIVLEILMGEEDVTKTN